MSLCEHQLHLMERKVKLCLVKLEESTLLRPVLHILHVLRLHVSG
jgi:hypothetical protein